MQNEKVTTTASEGRKSSKPMMEKRRRARINASLTELKSLLLEAIKKEGTRYNKMEKADILEMTVRHLKQLHDEPNSGQAKSSMLNKYTIGFLACAQEVGKYLSTSTYEEEQLKSKLLSHLTNCVTSKHHQSHVDDDVMSLTVSSAWAKEAPFCSDQEPEVLLDRVQNLGASLRFKNIISSSSSASACDNNSSLSSSSSFNNSSSVFQTDMETATGEKEHPASKTGESLKTTVFISPIAETSTSQSPSTTSLFPLSSSSSSRRSEAAAAISSSTSSSSSSLSSSRQISLACDSLSEHLKLNLRDRNVINADSLQETTNELIRPGAINEHPTEDGFNIGHCIPISSSNTVHAIQISKHANVISSGENLLESSEKGIAPLRLFQDTTVELSASTHPANSPIPSSIKPGSTPTTFPVLFASQTQFPNQQNRSQDAKPRYILYPDVAQSQRVVTLTPQSLPVMQDQHVLQQQQQHQSQLIQQQPQRRIQQPNLLPQQYHHLQSSHNNQQTLLNPQQQIGFVDERSRLPDVKQVSGLGTSLPLIPIQTATGEIALVMSTNVLANGSLPGYVIPVLTPTTFNAITPAIATSCVYPQSQQSLAETHGGLQSISHPLKQLQQQLKMSQPQIEQFQETSSSLSQPPDKVVPLLKYQLSVVPKSPIIANNFETSVLETIAGNHQSQEMKTSVQNVQQSQEMKTSVQNVQQSQEIKASVQNVQREEASSSESMEEDNNFEGQVSKHSSTIPTLNSHQEIRPTMPSSQRQNKDIDHLLRPNVHRRDHETDTHSEGARSNVMSGSNTKDLHTEIILGETATDSHPPQDGHWHSHGQPGLRSRSPIIEFNSLVESHHVSQRVSSDSIKPTKRLINSVDMGSPAFNLSDRPCPLSSSNVNVTPSLCLSSSTNVNVTPSLCLSSLNVNATPSHCLSSSNVNATPSQCLSSSNVNATPSQCLPSSNVNATPSQCLPSSNVNATPSNCLSSSNVNATPSNCLFSSNVNATPSNCLSSSNVNVTPSQCLPSSSNVNATPSLCLSSSTNVNATPSHCLSLSSNVNATPSQCLSSSNVNATPSQCLSSSNVNATPSNCLSSSNVNATPSQCLSSSIHVNATPSQCLPSSNVNATPSHCLSSSNVNATPSHGLSSSNVNATPSHGLSLSSNVNATPSQCLSSSNVNATPSNCLSSSNVNATPSNCLSSSNVNATPSHCLSSSNVNATPSQCLPSSNVNATPSQCLSSSNVNATPSNCLSSSNVNATPSQCLSSSINVNATHSHSPPGDKIQLGPSKSMLNFAPARYDKSCDTNAAILDLSNRSKKPAACVYREQDNTNPGIANDGQECPMDTDSEKPSDVDDDNNNNVITNKNNKSLSFFRPW